MTVTRENVTKSQRWIIADRLAEDRLETVNRLCRPVEPRRTFYSRFVKRGLDIIVSAAALVVTLPINAVAAVGTALDVGSPLFFKQTRVGKDGKTFTIVKFRNMTNETDENGELLPPSQRVTKFGRFMRTTSLDELLNFWNVFKGDMSIIGPRPLVPEYTHRYNDRHLSRLSVRPGLECPPRSLDEQVWTWDDQFENDVWYVENVSFKTDVKMLANLLRFALDRKSADARATADRGSFMGYAFDGTVINMEGVPQSYIDELNEAESDDL